MTWIVDELETIKRPKLLMRTARLGAEFYRRSFHLSRILGYSAPDDYDHILTELIELEAVTNEKRRTTDASYSVQFHIDVLIALICEARAYRASLTS